MGPNLLTGVFIRRRTFGHTQTHRGGHWKAEAVIGVMYLQPRKAKITSNHQSWRRPGRVLLYSLQRELSSASTLISGF